MMVPEMIERIGETIDRLVTLPIRTPGKDLLYFQDEVYRAARKMFGKPLTLLAAGLLQKRVHMGERVIFCTGAGTPPVLPQGETDGPIGTAALARAIHLGLGGQPVVVSEKFYWEPVAASFRACGIMPVEYASSFKLGYKVGFLEFPCDDDPIGHAQRVLEQVKPAAIIAVEKTGPNIGGVIHSASGEAKLEDARIDHLFRLGREQGILTLGVGDWGNEIGMGCVRETVQKAHPFGKICLCPCGAGIADATQTDVFIISHIANWGAYGVAAMLAVLLGDKRIFHDPDLERRMILECTRAGAADGSTRLSHGMVDGTSLSAQSYMVGLLGEIVERALSLPLLLEQTKKWEKDLLKEQGVLNKDP